jgi:hypothetical protein
LALTGPDRTMPPMNKRLLAAVLWFFAGWYLGGYISLIFGVPEAIGPVLGIAGAVVFAGDPLGIIWTKRAEPATLTTLDLENLPEDLAQAA